MKLVTVKPYKGDVYGGFKLPNDVVKSQEYKISAQFAKDSADTLRGLTFEEEKKYLPDILGVGPNDPKWKEATKEYWCNINIIVPEEGLLLNVDVKEDGEPENLLQWMLWRFIRKAGEVALNLKSVEWPTHKFYLIDSEESVKENKSAFELRNRANKAFLHLQTDQGKGKLEWVAVCLREKSERIPKGDEALLMFVEAKKDALDDQKQPVGLERFLKVVNDTDLEQKAMLYKLLAEGIVEKNGNSYFYGSDIMGTEREAVEWLKNPVHSKELLQIKEKLKAVA